MSDHGAWAHLWRRTLALGVLACPDCGGRLRRVATIADPRVIAEILMHLGLPVEPTRPADEGAGCGGPIRANSPAARDSPMRSDR